jgi:diacylglycerol kinase family enzyme
VPVLVNARARAGRKAGAAAMIEEVREACRDAGLVADVRAIEGAALERSAREAVAAGARSVVVAGGDGTVRSAAQVLAGTGVRLGILPLGTLNHFARDAGIPVDLVEAAKVVAAGTARAVDVGDLDGVVFVNTSSLGFYPHLVRVRDQHERSSRLGRLGALVPATWRVLRRFRSMEVHVRGPGSETETIRTPLVFVGNNEHELGPRIGRRERLDRGVLFFAALPESGRFALLATALRSLVVSTLPEGTRAMLAREITVDVGPRRTWVGIDGEVRPVRGVLHYRVRPGALEVLAPGPGAKAETP